MGPAEPEARPTAVAAALRADERDDDTVDLLRFGAALVTLVMAVVLFHAG